MPSPQDNLGGTSTLDMTDQELFEALDEHEQDAEAAQGKREEGEEEVPEEKAPQPSTRIGEELPAVPSRQQPAQGNEESKKVAAEEGEADKELAELKVTFFPTSISDVPVLLRS